jgi:hypothetical protein
MTTRARVTTDLGVVSEMDGDGGIDDQFHMVHAIGALDAPSSSPFASRGVSTVRTAGGPKD